MGSSNDPCNPKTASTPVEPQAMPAFAYMEQLNAGHERFLRGHSRHPHSSAQRLQQLVKGQHPGVAILSCSDSRVPLELLFDAGFGDLFVVRNAGNTSTSATIASLEYGVQALGISLLLVMGHEGCGAVTAACQPHGTLTPKLAELVLTIRGGLDEVDASGDLASAFRHNPIQAARHLVLGSELLRNRIDQGELLIESACYTLARGEIEWLGCLDSAGGLHPTHARLGGGLR